MRLRWSIPLASAAALCHCAAAAADRRDFELADVAIREPQPRVLTVDSNFNLTLLPGRAAPKNLRVRVFAGTITQQLAWGETSPDECPKYDTLVVALDLAGDALRFGWGIPREWAEIGGSGTREYLLVFEKPEARARAAAGSNWKAEPFRLAKECVADYFRRGYRIEVRSAQKPAAPVVSGPAAPFTGPAYVQLVKVGQCFRIRGGCGLTGALAVVPCEPPPRAMETNPVD